jgi:3'-phosphoadenosine 5'-phosphosulfate sulfotransferase (PAPS reductase)/FAD synthetase/3'-phosphoadenosine 5'-phosphosulfate sulfotransferase
MFKILVRSKKDRNAVSKAVDLFYRGWGISVESTGGNRGREFTDAIIEKLEPFTLVLAGRRDFEHALEAFSQAGIVPFTGLILVDRSEIRNARLEMIGHAIDRGRAMIRAGLSYTEKGSILAFSTTNNIIKEYHPEMDNFIISGRTGAELLSEITGKTIDPPIIAYKYGDGVHEFYKCGKLVAKGRLGMFKTELAPVSNNDYSCSEDLLQLNTKVIREMDNYLKKFLESNAKEADIVVVPWSGGKDSTAVLISAVEVFGREKVVAVYSDTGVEFPDTLRYVDSMAKKLGVRLITVKAGLDNAIRHRGLPRLGERWCTGLKLEALQRVFHGLKNEYGRLVVLVGDRDAESKIRVKRPPARMEEDRLVLSPLKIFGGGHVELYILSKGYELNPLYTLGFYRVGCYICPSLRHWELSIIRKAGLVGRDNLYFNMFTKEREQ